MADYYLDMGPPPDPIADGLAAFAASQKGKSSPSDFKVGKEKGGEMMAMGAPGTGMGQGVDPGEKDYWKGKLRQDMQNDPQLMQQDMQATPQGAETFGSMYA